MSQNGQKINTVLTAFADTEFHISHYDDEGFATINIVGEALAAILTDLGAQRVADTRYRLAVEKLGEFCDQRFGVQRVAHRDLRITDSQRQARSENMRRAQAARWAKVTN